MRTEKNEQQAQPIGRRQAWAKLIVLMAEENLPDPKSIDFNEQANSEIFTIHVDAPDSLRRWAEALNCKVGRSERYSGKVQHYANGHRSWHGLTAWVYAYTDDFEAELGDIGDLTSVRSIAADGGESE